MKRYIQSTVYVIFVIVTFLALAKSFMVYKNPFDLYENPLVWLALIGFVMVIVLKEIVNVMAINKAKELQNEKDGVVPFSAEGGDDRFTKPLGVDEVNAMLKGSLDTQLVQNVDNPNVYDTSIIYNTKLAPSPDSIYTFRLKEQWIFDKKTSRMYCRIIGIAPVATIVINNKPVKRTLFWLYYPELRASLAKNEVYNPKNISTRITWEELFESRYFNSYIVKSSIDNYNDKLLNAIYKDPLRRLQEGEKIRQKIFDYEQDRWVY